MSVPKIGSAFLLPVFCIFVIFLGNEESKSDDEVEQKQDSTETKSLTPNEPCFSGANSPWFEQQEEGSNPPFPRTSSPLDQQPSTPPTPQVPPEIIIIKR